MRHRGRAAVGRGRRFRGRQLIATAQYGDGGQPTYRGLIVEDQELIVMLLEDMLLDVGCEVGEAVSRLEEALRAAQEGTFDFAILDVNLHGLPSYPVADILSARGVPFAFATGYGSDSLDPAYAAVPILLKPFTQADLTAVVSRLVSLGAVSRADDCGDVTKHRLE